MNDIVRYQLRKPANILSDNIGLARLDLSTELKRLADGLAKVYRDKQPDISIDVGDGARFQGDRGDFLELAGNLLDNACKWCEQKVMVSVAAGQDNELLLSVADDGPGIPADIADRLIERGMRLDESAPGHGIGLAVVRDLAASHGGDVRITKSALGGAEVIVRMQSGAA